MKKEYILTFCISFLILATVVVISLMMLLPQETTVIDGSVEEYTSLNQSDYTFKETNSLTFDNTFNYTITSEQISNFRKRNLYVPGNSDPFTAQSNTTSNSSTTSGTTNSSTSTQDKITNSNNGVANPESTGK